MPCNWIGWFHQGQVGKRWSLRQKAHRYDPEGKSCNAGRKESDMELLAEFLTEQTREEWPTSF